MSLSETLRRLPRVVLGLFLFGAGIALMIVGNLGLGPWDVFHQGLSDRFGWSIGTIIIGVGLVVVLGFIPLREKVGIGTLLNAVLIGLSVDWTRTLLPQDPSLGLRIVMMVAGPVVIAVGSGLYLGGGLGPGPRDGIMTGLAKRGVDVWKARLGIELVVLLAGWLLGGTIGVGTLWFAFGIGPMVHYFLPRLSMDPPQPTTLESA